MGTNEQRANNFKAMKYVLWCLIVVVDWVVLQEVISYKADESPFQKYLIVGAAAATNFAVPVALAYFTNQCIEKREHRIPKYAVMAGLALAYVVLFFMVNTLRMEHYTDADNASYGNFMFALMILLAVGAYVIDLVISQKIHYFELQHQLDDLNEQFSAARGLLEKHRDIDGKDTNRRKKDFERLLATIQAAANVAGDSMAESRAVLGRVIGAPSREMEYLTTSPRTSVNDLLLAAKAPTDQDYGKYFGSKQVNDSVKVNSRIDAILKEVAVPAKKQAVI